MTLSTSGSQSTMTVGSRESQLAVTSPSELRNVTRGVCPEDLFLALFCTWSISVIYLSPNGHELICWCIYFAIMSPDGSLLHNTDLDCIAAWIKANKLKMSISKTQLMTLGRRTSGCTAPQIDIHLKGSSIPQSDSIECLVVTVDQDLRWGQRCKRAFAAVACLWKASHYFQLSMRKMLHQFLVPQLGLLFHCMALLQPGTLPIHQECTKLRYESLPQPAPRTPSGILKDQCGSTSLHKRHYSSLLHQVQLCSNKLSI